MKKIIPPCPVCQGTDHRRSTIQRTDCWSKAVGRHRGYAFRSEDQQPSVKELELMATMQEYAAGLPW